MTTEVLRTSLESDNTSKIEEVLHAATYIELGTYMVSGAIIFVNSHKM